VSVNGNGSAHAQIDPSRLRIAPIGAHARGESFTASSVLTYLLCPTRYYLHYRLGFPEEIRFDALDDREQFARVFRRVAARLDSVFDSHVASLSSGEIVDAAVLVRSAAVEGIVDEALALEPTISALRTKLRSRAIDMVARLAASENARAVIAPSGAECKSDHELRMPFGDHFLIGTIDRLVRHSDGTLSFTQFKTVRASDSERQRIADAFLPQLQIYAYLIGKSMPSQPTVRGTLIFVDAPESPSNYSFTREDLIAIERDLHAHITAMHSIRTGARSDLPTVTDHCPACPYAIEGRCIISR
jgi:CRISPR/Cas system-associated exonuclease Cas4 (RecB family)